MRSIIELHDKYLAYVTTCFMGASLFHKSLKVGVSGGGRIRGLGFAGLQLPHPSFKQDPSKTLSMRSGAGTCPDVLSEQSRLCPASFTRGIAAHMCEHALPPCSTARDAVLQPTFSAAGLPPWSRDAPQTGAALPCVACKQC